MKKLFMLISLVVLSITLTGCVEPVEEPVEVDEYPHVYVYDTCSMYYEEDDEVYISKIGNFSTVNYITLYVNEDGTIILETEKLVMDITNTVYTCKRVK